jgi:hypothetical protein
MRAQRGSCSKTTRKFAHGCAGAKQKAKSLLTYLEQAAEQADPMQYKVLRPALLELEGTHFWLWRLGHAGSRDDRAQIFIRHKHLAPLYALTLDRNDLLCEPLGAAATR